MEIKGIDISRWQGEIDFNNVKASGIDFVIIRAVGENQKIDPLFKANYEKARAAKLNIGCYYFANRKFRGAEAGVIAANNFIEIIKGLKFEYPVYLDIEAQDNRYKNEITEATIAFCDSMEKAGYFVGIYASDISGFKDRLILDKVKKYAAWVARYGKDPEYCKDWGIWQYTSKGSIPGIIGSVDLDVSKVDYAKVITEKGFNNYPKKEKKTKKKEA